MTRKTFTLMVTVDDQQDIDVRVLPAPFVAPDVTLPPIDTRLRQDFDLIERARRKGDRS